MLSPTGLPLASAQHLLGEARRLVERGMDVSLLIPNHYHLTFERSDYRDSENIEGVKAKHVYLPWRWRGAIRTDLSPFGYWTWKLFRRALEERFDIIHIMKPCYTSASAGLFLHLLTGKPMVLECDDLEGSTGWGKSLSEEPLFALKTHITDIYERRLPLLANAVIADTRALHEMLLAYGVEKGRLFYIPYCVEYYMRREGDGERIREKLGLKDEPLAIYCGALHPHNYDCDLLIDAMSIVHDRLRRAKMLIVGDGGAKPALEEMARERGLLGNVVAFTGWVSREEIPDYIAAADAGVVPMRDTGASRSRGLSKVLEYLCQAVPVVIPGIGQAEELTDSGRAGVLVRPGDAPALAEGILQLLVDPALARRKGGCGKKYVASKFDPSGATKKIIEVYESVLP